MNRSGCVALCLFFGLFLSRFSVKGIEVSAAVNTQRLGVEDQLALILTVKGESNPPDPDLSGLADFILIPGSKQSANDIVMNSGGTLLLTRYVYQLRPRRVGQLTIPLLSLKIAGQRYQTRPLKVEVLPGRMMAGSHPEIRQLPASYSDPLEALFELQSQGDRVSFLRSLPVKRRLFLGEAMALTIALYSDERVEEAEKIGSVSVPGFWVDWQEPQAVERGWLEEVEGKEVSVSVIDRGVFIPLRVGTLEIPLFEYRLSFTSATGPGASPALNGQQTRSTEKLSIEVVPLPPVAKGLPVGRFQITGDLSHEELDVNELLTLRLTFKGQGNVKDLQAPTLPAIPGMKSYSAEVRRQSRIVEKGVESEMTAEYPITLSRSGTLVVPALSLSYFDPDLERVETVQTTALTVRVTGQRKGVTGQRGATSQPRLGVNREVAPLELGSIEDPRQGWTFGQIFRLSLFLPFLLPISYLIMRFVIKPLRTQSGDALRREELQGLIASVAAARSSEALLGTVERFLSLALEIRPSDLTRSELEQRLTGLGVAQGLFHPVLDQRDQLLGMRYAGDGAQGAQLEMMKPSVVRLMERLLQVQG